MDFFEKMFLSLTEWIQGIATSIPSAIGTILKIILIFIAARIIIFLVKKMLKSILFQIMRMTAVFHEKILRLNNSFEANLTDKELHFLVIGLLGMGIYLVIQPVFSALARRGWEAAISWIYTLTVIVVITFAIEIGQHITGTGSMEFADIVFGIVGFLLMYLVYALIAGLIKLIRRLFDK